MPYDSNKPVVCFDERPCFLIGDRVEGLEMSSGQVKREHYAYEKHGSCCVLASIEPLTGQRIAHVRKQRTKKEFAHFMKAVFDSYQHAERVHIVLDNLSTHDKGAFYEHFDAEIAEQMSQKLYFVFTPKSASWLNMVEIEFSALSRQCLNRRIPCMKILEKEVLAFFSKREKKRIGINWQFTPEKARSTLNRHYTKVNEQNKKYK